MPSSLYTQQLYSLELNYFWNVVIIIKMAFHTPYSGNNNYFISTLLVFYFALKYVKFFCPTDKVDSLSFCNQILPDLQKNYLDP